jgi:hypothetical protein
MTAWVEHLRAGGTTPWADFRRAESDPSTGAGAQQLEVLRRLNALGRPSAGLVERVLNADLVGRGRGDLALSGTPARRFGTPPVDPAALPPAELLRVVTGLLAEDVVAAGAPSPPRPRRPRFRRVRYRLHGDPRLAVPIREELVRRGYPTGGGRAVTFLLGRDLGGMLVDAWTRRALVDGVIGWEGWLAKLRRSDRLPARADLLRQARWWARRVGHHGVRIVTDPALLPGILRVDGPLPQPPTVAADALDLARRMAPMVGLLAGHERREQLMRHGLVPRLAGEPGEPLAVPERFRPWLLQQARAQREGLLAQGYAVHGDLAHLDPVERAAGGGSPSVEAVLELGLRMLLERSTA